jgi:hypothetical protein
LTTRVWRSRERALLFANSDLGAEVQRRLRSAVALLVRVKALIAVPSR